MPLYTVTISVEVEAEDEQKAADAAWSFVESVEGQKLAGYSVLRVD